MRALLARLLLLLPLLAAAEDTATVRITPQQLNPGEPFRMEIVIDSTDDFPGPALRIASELPVVDDIPLRFAGQRGTQLDVCVRVIDTAGLTFNRTFVVNEGAVGKPSDW